MKKINLLFIAFIAMFTFACNSNSSSETVEETDVATETVENATVETNSNNNLPQFEDKELTNYVVEFNAFFDKSMELLKAGDMEALQALEAEGKELEAKGNEFKDKISEADKAKLEEYLKGKAQEMLKASGLDQMIKNAEENSAE